jgi:hypothetical protein
MTRAPLIALVLLSLAGSVLAQSALRPVVDPTVPPPGFGARGAGAGGARGTGGAGDAVAEAAPAPARLQMIVRGPGETRVALIAGQSVRVGESVSHAGRAMRVAQITDSAVLLADGAHAPPRVALELLPGLASAVRCAGAATRPPAATPAFAAPGC